MILRNPYIICTCQDSVSIFDENVMVRKYVAAMDDAIYNRLYFYFHYRPNKFNNAIVHDFKFTFDFEENHKRYTGIPFKHKPDSLNSVAFFNPKTSEQIVLKNCLIIANYSLYYSGNYICFNYYYKDIYSKILKLDRFLNDACTWNNKGCPIIVTLDYKKVK